MAEQAVSNVATNISAAIQNKANGKPSSQPQENGQSSGGEQTPPVDINAGKKKYVVEGQEVFLTPEEVDTWAQKAMGYEKKLTKMSHLQNEVGEFIKTLSSDPLKILTDKRIGMTPEVVLDKIFASGQIGDAVKEKIGKWYYENVIMPMKSPEEFERLQKDKKLSDYELQEKRRGEEEIKKENQAKVNAAMFQIKAQVAEAMRESGLPSNDTPLAAEMARMVADVMRKSYFSRQPVTPKQAIEYVKKRIIDVQSSFYDNLEDEKLIETLGEKNIERIKKHLLKLVKASDKNSVVNSPRTVLRNGDRKTTNLDDFHEYLDELKRKG